jgi:hypothetical protein
LGRRHILPITLNCLPAKICPAASLARRLQFSTVDPLEEQIMRPRWEEAKTPAWTGAVRSAFERDARGDDDDPKLFENGFAGIVGSRL